jgi:chorismate mutase/prephenate dehydratase
MNEGPLPDKCLRAVYRELMSASLALEKSLVISYLGPEDTFSHLAAQSKFGQSVEYAGRDTIEEVFKDVAGRMCDYGVVPVETSSGGAVTDTMDLFMHYDTKICAEVYLAINHCLAAKGSLGEIRRVYSKPQALAQCKRWLATNLPQAELIGATSTAKACAIAAEEAGSAAVASAAAAAGQGLSVLAEGIQDRHPNVTRFFVLSDHIAKPTGRDKTSIMFSIKDKVGALHDMLMPTKRHGINMTRIESRPSRTRAWDYYFFVDLVGHCEDEPVKEALEELDDQCRMLVVLGSYPAASPNG